MKKMMLFAILLSNMLSANSQAPAGYDIGIQLKPYQNKYIYLAYYYGNSKGMADSVLLDGNSMGRFKGSKPLEGGIYFIVSPNRQILFEMLIDKDQQFEVRADTTDMPFSIQFTGSAENQRFRDYSVFSSVQGRKLGELNAAYATAKNKKDSTTITDQIRKQTLVLQHFRDSLTQKHPESFLATLFSAMSEPHIPPASQQPGGKYDSNFVYEYYKGHYWDGISFSDSRLVRTPFFEARLEKYYSDLVSPAPDSIIKEADHMLLYARTSPEMFKFMMVFFVQRYINPKFMGQDAVFVHLFDKYINTGKTEFFTPQYKEFAAKRAYSMMANLIGKQAAPLDMVDTLERPDRLYDINANFIVICFWDPACSHCKEIVPKVDSIYRAKWKNLGVQIYGVKVDGTREDWVKFIRDHHLDNWHHVYQLSTKREEEIRLEKPGYHQLYDVYQTPQLYLLDKDKRIIAKKLTYLQIDEVIDAKLQSKK